MDTPPRLEDALLAILRDGSGTHATQLRARLVELLQWLTSARYDTGDPESPVVAADDALRAFLDHALRPAPVEPDLTTPEAAQEAVGDPREEFADQLAGLWDMLRNKSAARPFTDAYDAAGAGERTPGQRAWRLWTLIHLVSLRVPKAEAEQIRADAWGLAAGWNPDVTRPAGGDVSLPPPLPGLGPDGAATDDLPDVAAGGEAGRAAVALARQMLWLAAHDPCVLAGHPSIGVEQVAPFSSTTLGLYRKEFKQGLEDLEPAEPGSKAELIALARLDEAARGVVPMPLPPEGSWWRDRLAQSQGALQNHPCGKAIDFNLEAPFRSLGNKVDDNNVAAGKDWITDPGRHEGKVLWILRFPREGERGRVIYLPNTAR